MDAALRALLTPFEPDALLDDPATIYAVDGTLRLRFVNRAWHRFARENGAAWADDEHGPWSVGAHLMDAVPTVLRPFYEELLREARGERTPLDHAYECSSSTRERRFRMRVWPCGQDGALFVHSLVHDVRYPGVGSQAIEGLYRDERGLIVTCSSCRRVRRARPGVAQWDWVPAYVERMPDGVSHGLCELCSRFYYPSG